MDSFKDSITFWATVLGTLLALFGAVQSLGWLVVIGAFIVVGSICVLVYARKQALRVKSGTLKVGGRSIDSLNMASLRRRTNGSLVVQRADYRAAIDGEDLAMTWKVSGYCRASSETAMEFSIDADTNIPFSDLDCVGYDLRHDPGRRYPIHPILLGPDGISKKVSVPFLAPLSSQDPFHMVLRCDLPGCMKAGEDYCAVTLSFGQDRVARYTMRLTFLHGRPDWVRAYKCGADGEVRLLRSLQAQGKGGGVFAYVDTGTNVTARTARVYMFSRRLPVSGAAASKEHPEEEASRYSSLATSSPELDFGNDPSGRTLGFSGLIDDSPHLQPRPLGGGGWGVLCRREVTKL